MASADDQEKVHMAGWRLNEKRNGVPLKKQDPYCSSIMYIEFCILRILTKVTHYKVTLKTRIGPVQYNIVDIAASGHQGTSPTVLVVKIS